MTTLISFNCCLLAYSTCGGCGSKLAERDAEYLMLAWEEGNEEEKKLL